ncbi:major facilitator superfamily domain-containing protein [Trichoderma sp. SZMC 28014]
MSDKEDHFASSDVAPLPKEQRHPVKWYRSTFYNMTILGFCNLAAPGIWGAMNSLGAGGSQSPQLVNAANALTFCLMVVSCYFSSIIIKYIGVKGALVFGTMGYAPYAAGLYTNNRFGTTWLVILGAALCGISAGTFWAVEAAIAIAYPEPWNRGKSLGWWLTFRVMGQIIGGAINLSLDIDRNKAGKVSYTVYIIFITIQAAGALIALLLNRPQHVQRQDGKKVHLAIVENPWYEIKATAKAFINPHFLLIVLWIGQAVFSEAVYFTYLSLWFSVRARALGSFLGGVVAVIIGNLTGWFLDRTKVPLKVRARYTFWFIVVTQGAWWLWATVISTRYRRTLPTYDWEDSGFGSGFGVYIFLTFGFQINYLFLYFIVTHLAKDQGEVIRYAALLRGTESAWQAVSYGLTSLTVFAQVGGIYMNFILWAIAILPAWLVVRHIGSKDGQWDRESGGSGESPEALATEETVTPSKVHEA